MKFIIEKSGEHIGELVFDGDMHHFTGNQEFEAKLATIIRGGVSLMNDIVFDDKRWIIDEPIAKSDIRFPVAVVEHLRRRGFTVQEVHQDIENIFETLVGALPSDAAIVVGLRAMWKRMSYLEKTDFLGTVKKEYSKTV